MYPRHTRLAAPSVPRKLGAPLAVLGLILVVLNPSAPADALPADPPQIRILEVRTEGTGSLRLTFIAPPGAELALLRGDRVDAIDTEILTTRVDATGQGTLTYAPGAPGSPMFLRLRASPWTTLETSSPAPEETSVALTRETRLRFTQALAPASVLGTNHLFATFGGRRLLSRVELGADRQTATLFYLEPLPAGARIEVTWDATGLRDHSGRELDSDADGTPGGMVVWNFETVSVTPVFGTSVVGRVFASDPLDDGRGGVTNRPLAGVTISVDGAEETLRTLTAPDGSFTLAPCPAGAFFVTVDGRTAADSAWPNGAYYPVVSKLWDAVPGATNQVNDTGEIFLPRIGAGALVPVSTTAETEIRFPAEVLRQNPALEGVSLRVPPNTLYSDAGLRGGRVGMAAVAPDRLPEPLPPGLELPLVITIQTDGPQNFSLPVPVRFPNLPDPATGLLAPPGSKSALWSFNHDTGHWEIQGPMTVTDDGRFVETDPGVGVRQPGWHGVRSGTQTDGAKPWFCGAADFNPSNFAEPCQRSGSAIACGVLGDTWNKWARCGSSFLPGTAIKQAAECATSLTRTVVDLFDRSVNTRDDIAAANDDRGTDVLRVFTLAAKVITTGTLTTLDCVKELAASQTVDRFLNCGSAFTASLNSVCDQLVNPVGCNQSSTLAGACAGVDALDRGFDVAGALRTGEGFRNAKELGEKVTAGFEALDGLVDLASNLVGADALALASPSGAETESEARARSLALAAFWQRAPAAERARMLALMDQIVATLRELRTLAPRLEQLMHSTADLSLRSQDMALRMGRLAHDFGFATEGPVYYALESGGRVQRGLSHGTLRLILAPSTDYVLHLYQPQQGLYGRTLGLTAAAGFVTTIPGVPMAVLEGVDTDGDALVDDAEFVIGTSASARDTDADGAADGAEVLAGANPLDGLAVRTGVLASAPTRSPATALALDATMAVTATSAPGLSFFDLANPLRPVRRSDLPLPAAALDLAFQSGYAAVAAGAQGLLLVDARLADAPRRTHQV
ncbi:MAG: hypothetical protein IT580_16535, partial [Verrucomicrobiales bacterium]|nr:hypothetical protein [Verrucomicrobiales bacterium]